MRKLLLALALLLPSPAWAQCNGVFPANTLCGNLSASPAPPAAFSAAGTIVGPASSTSGFIPTWANSLGTLLGSFNTISTSQSITFTGITTFTSASTFTNTTSFNALTTFSGLTNFTSQFQVGGQRMQFPATADTVGGLGTTQTWTGANSYTGTTSFSAASAPTGAGITSIFANPPPIGSGTDNTGQFTTLKSSLFTANGQLCSATVQGVCIANLTSQTVLQTTAAGSVSVQIGTTSVFTVNSVGHANSQTSAPSGCSGFSAAAGSTDLAGKATYTLAGSCTVTFANPFSSPPACAVMPGTAGSNIFVTTTTTNFTVTFGTNQSALSWVCMGL